MQRRTLLVSLGIGAIASVAGCTGSGTKQQSSEPVRYFFKDETGALGHMKDEGEPARDEKVVTNILTEDEYQELQTNDIQFVEQAAEKDIKPMWRDGLIMFKINLYRLSTSRYSVRQL